MLIINYKLEILVTNSNYKYYKDFHLILVQI